MVTLRGGPSRLRHADTLATPMHALLFLVAASYVAASEVTPALFRVVLATFLTAPLTLAADTMLNRLCQRHNVRGMLPVV